MLPTVKHSCQQEHVQTNAQLTTMARNVTSHAQQTAPKLGDGSTHREFQVARRRMASASNAMTKSGGERRAKMHAPQVVRMINATSQMACAKEVARTASSETNVTRSAQVAATVVVARKTAANATMAATLDGAATSVINHAQKALVQKGVIVKLGSPRHVSKAVIRSKVFWKMAGFARVAQTTARPTSATSMESALMVAKLDSTAICACRVAGLTALVLVTPLPLV
jgi:hypothetical protein